MLSDTAEYALRATLYIAQNATPDRPVRVDEVAEALGLPRNSLSKTLHVLAKRSILVSTRGPAGGFQLAPRAELFPLARIIDAFDPLEPKSKSCVLGRAMCNDRNPCPAHNRWSKVSDMVRSFFRDTTVGDLLQEEGSLQ